MTPITFNTGTAQTRTCNDEVANRLISQFNIMLEGQLFRDNQTPLGIHWCLGPELQTAQNLGIDGHAKLGSLLPPIPYPRRMWAGGELVISELFQINDDVKKTSVVTDIQHKTGSSGQLFFLTVTHNFFVQDKKMLSEKQHLVFKENNKNVFPQKGTTSKKTEQVKLPNSAMKKAIYDTDPVLLFRYSALTFNGHRIHYDIDHAKKVEGQQGLVVHGPLQATWLLNLAAIHLDRVPKRFAYKNLSPLISGEAAHLWVEEGDEMQTLKVYCCDENKRIIMKGEVFF